MSRVYKPDSWVVVKITTKETNETIYKIFAGWYGGYTSGDSWKLSSTVQSVVSGDTGYEVSNSSGSLYILHPKLSRLSGYCQSVLDGFLALSGETAIVEISSMEEVLANVK